MKPFWVYILRCGDGSYYCGHTDDLAQRLGQHDAGDQGYTSTRKPLELAWQGEFESREAALAFEIQVKGWSRAKKEALMRGDWASVQALARSRGLRQAQPERVGGVARGTGTQSDSVTPGRPDHPNPVRLDLTNPVGTDPTNSVGPDATNPVRPEPVEGLFLSLRDGEEKDSPSTSSGTRSRYCY
jgi:LAO/AO transport system kinase